MAPGYDLRKRLTPRAHRDRYEPDYNTTYPNAYHPSERRDGQYEEARRWTGRGSQQAVSQRYSDSDRYAAGQNADARRHYDWHDYRDTRGLNEWHDYRNAREYNDWRGYSGTAAAEAAETYPSTASAYQQELQYQQHYQQYAPTPPQWQYRAAETWRPGLTYWPAVNVFQQPPSQSNLGFFDPNVAPFVPQQAPKRYEQNGRYRQRQMGTTKSTSITQAQGHNDVAMTRQGGSAATAKKETGIVKNQGVADSSILPSDLAAQSNVSSQKRGSPRVNLIPKPLPTSAYLERAHRPPRISESPHTLLVILDLNGTVLCRNGRGTNFTPRPHVMEFLAYLLTQHKIMIWSSAQPVNVRGMCEKLFTPLQHQHLTAVWGRDMLRLGTHYHSNVQVYKRLAWVWESPAMQASAIDPSMPWSQSNTVLIDDSIEKASSEPFNLIEIEEFEKRPEQMSEDVLGQLVLYLETLRWQEDVSAYMRETPFRFDRAKEGAQWDLLV